MKAVYTRRTNHGGGRGDKSKLLGVARWLQRRMLWLSGITFEEMEREVKRLGLVPNILFAADDDDDDIIDDYFL